jgi:hypothetical protein
MAPLAVALEPKGTILFFPQSPQLVVGRLLVVTRAQEVPADQVQAVAVSVVALLRLVELETEVTSPR